MANLFLERLKKLTPEQCVVIARLWDNEIAWEFVVPTHTWHGFDLFGSHGSCFQIDLRDECDIPSGCRIRFYDSCMYEYPAINDAILNYIFSSLSY